MSATIIGKRRKLVTLAQVNEVVNADDATFKAMLETMRKIPVTKVAETSAQIRKAKGSEESRNILSNVVKGTEVWSSGRTGSAGIRCV